MTAKRNFVRFAHLWLQNIWRVDMNSHKLMNFNKWINFKNVGLNTLLRSHSTALKPRSFVRSCRYLLNAVNRLLKIEIWEFVTVWNRIFSVEKPYLNLFFSREFCFFRFLSTLEYFLCWIYGFFLWIPRGLAGFSHFSLVQLSGPLPPSKFFVYLRT